VPGDQGYFASVPTGLHGFTTRHLLAQLYRSQGLLGAAESQWQAALAEQPDFIDAWMGLANLCLDQRRWDELQEISVRLERDCGQGHEAAVLRARGHLARKEFDSARRLLEETIACVPHWLWPRVLLSHVLLQEGRDWPAAEWALRDVLARAPDHAEARHNLDVLLQRGRPGSPAC
jgi:hypothetical protein